MTGIVDATTDTFQEETASGLVLVDFWAAWCGPCRQLGPVLEQIAQSRDDVKIVKVDVDAEPELAGRFGITSIPAMKIFRDGQLVEEMTGVRPRPVIEQALDRA